MPKELTAFRLEQAQLDGLRILKERDGMSISDQVAKAVDNWLTDKGATFADAQRLFDEFEDGLATASNARELGKFKLPQEFGASLGGRFLAELTRKQMEAVDRFARWPNSRLGPIGTSGGKPNSTTAGDCGKRSTLRPSARCFD